MPAALLVNDTVVALLCAALMVTLRVPVPPCVMVSDVGWRLAIVGGTVLTSTVAVAEPPLRVAVIWALPVETAVTGIAMLVCCAVNGMLLGTVATPVLLLLTVRLPAKRGFGERVAVTVPDEPTVKLKGFGVSAVGVGRILTP